MRLISALAIGISAAAPAAAETLAAMSAAPEVALIDGWRQDDGSRVAAVEIRLAPGWHTYWRVPGEAGIPPTFDWTASVNLASVTYEWPRPAVFDRYGLKTFGYADTLVLPVLLTPTDPAAPIEVALDLAFGICEDICVPAEARVTTRLAPDAPAAGRERIEAALADRARSAAEAGVARVTCALAPAADGYELTAEVTFAAEPAPGQVAVLESGQPGLWIGEPSSRTEGRTVTARASVLGAGEAGPMLERQDLRVTVLDAERAVDIQGCEAPG
jgi:DsbC/DsbD-like thiol-disulfide interchange protein